jgi:extracellular factor (EF) 3-hydroxypalmitic acid methyl ester biosynthesis protein
MQTITANVFTPAFLPFTSVSAPDSTYGALRSGNIAPTLDELFDDLEARREESPAEWAGYARTCLGHPLAGLLHQDPFTERAFSKPRGYAGDAVMMDFIYGLGETARAACEATPLGRAIFQYMGTRPSAQAVRYRRRLLAGLIDQAAQRGGARVLAIAAGHLREVELSTAVKSGAISEFVALDQDEDSLSEVDQHYGRLGIRTLPGSVRQILSGKVTLREYDFVYAAGLFDYLSAPVAGALTQRMFDMVRPGGRMLIPNFRIGTRDRGYMESFMDWHLIYRNEKDMCGLVSVLPKRSVADFQIFDHDVDTVTYLMVSKAS